MSAGPVSAASGLTTEKPMAATRADIVHGGFVSWLAFVTLLEALLVLTFLISAILNPGANSPLLPTLLIGLIYGAAIGGGVALVADLVAMPFAWLIARALAHERRIRVHVAAYAALGVAIGLAVAGAASLMAGSAAIWWTPLPLLATVLAAASAVFGWWRASRTARWALRGDL